MAVKVLNLLSSPAPFQHPSSPTHDVQSQAAYALEDNKKVVRITLVALSSSVHCLVAVFCGRPVGWLIRWCVTVSLSWQCARSLYGVGRFSFRPPSCSHSSLLHLALCLDHCVPIVPFSSIDE